ncbi:unnamed protein product [Closterium sp. Yama58-4]|nr:unnamed protein product [Closterium sp. Yama58-4]
MGEVEGTNYRAGNGLTRRVQGVGEDLEGVTLPSPFAAEMTEAEADELVKSQRALYQQALKRRETIPSNACKKKCTNTLLGVPAPKKKPRAAKSGKKKGKQGRKAGATTGNQADLPALATTEEELVTEALPDLPLPASSQQQQQAVTNPNPPPASFLQQLFTNQTALPVSSQPQHFSSCHPNRPLPATRQQQQQPVASQQQQQQQQQPVASQLQHQQPVATTQQQQHHNLEFLADATTGALAGDFLTDNRSAFDKELDE